MTMKVSGSTKAIVGMVWTVCTGIGATFPNTVWGKAAIVTAGGLASLIAIWKSKNTQTVSTGPVDGPVVIADVVSDSGAVIGSVLADTGAAAGGIVAGTTGVAGGLLDATVGRLLPGGG